MSYIITDLKIHPRSLSYILKTIFVSTNFRDDHPDFSVKWKKFKDFLGNEKYKERSEAIILVRPISDAISGMDLSKDGISYMKKADFEDLDFYSKKDRKHLGNATYISYKGEIEKENLYSSINEGMEFIEQELSISAFNNEPIHLDKTSIIVLIKTEDDKYKMIAKDKIFNISSNRKRNWVSGNFSEIKPKIDSMSNKDKERIYSSLKNYSMGQSSFSNETSFIMYWSSLENLLKVGTHRSLVDYLTSTVLAMLSLKYLRSLLENFFSDLLILGITEIDFENEKIKLELAMPQNDLLYSSFVHLMNDERTQNLDEKLSEYALLDHRWKKIKEIFSDDKKLSDLILNHHRKINWHIFRLYRVRNKIVHSALTDNNILSLTQHLDFYIREMISEILNNIDEIRDKELPSALISLESKYEYLAFILSDTKKALNRAEIFATLFPEGGSYL